MNNQTFTQRMAQLQTPGKREALRMLLAGDKSAITCRIAGADKRHRPAPLSPLHGSMVIDCRTAFDNDPSLPF